MSEALDITVWFLFNYFIQLRIFIFSSVMYQTKN
jgi:hypothetical protein